MPTDTLCIVGAGGHAKVVVDTLLQNGCDPGALVVAVTQASVTPTLLGIAIHQIDAASGSFSGRFHVAIGDNQTRQRLFGQFAKSGGQAATVQHKTAIVSPHAHIGAGTFVAAQSVVGPGSALGEGVIVNHAAVIDHDCRVGAFAHIAGGAVFGGSVTVGERTLIGLGARVLPGVTIGADAVIGAGAVVTKDVASGMRVVGVPGRKV